MPARSPGGRCRETAKAPYSSLTAPRPAARLLAPSLPGQRPFSRRISKHSLPSSSSMCRSSAQPAANPAPKGGRRWLPVPYTKDKAEKDFALLRKEVFGKNEQRQLADMRRSGAVEADAGGTTDEDLANKMANTINASARLRKTYTPVNVVSVRRVDEARQRGRKAIKDNSQ